MRRARGYKSAISVPRDAAATRRGYVCGYVVEGGRACVRACVRVRGCGCARSRARPRVWLWLWLWLCVRVRARGRAGVCVGVGVGLWVCGCLGCVCGLRRKQALWIARSCNAVKWHGRPGRVFHK